MANQKLAVVCLVILIFANVLGVYLHNYLGDDDETYSSDSLEQVTDSIDSDTVEYNATGFINVLKAFAGVIFWSFGLLPWWLDLILWILRIIVIAYVVDVILP